MIESVSKRLPRNFGLGVGVFLTLVILVFFSKKYYEKPVGSHPEVIQKGASFVKSSADLAFHAQQVENPLVALSNVYYAKAYLDIARSLVSDSELSERVKLSLDDLQEDIEREETIAKERILQVCPSVGARGRLAQATGWKASEETLSPPSPSTSIPTTQFTGL